MTCGMLRTKCPKSGAMLFKICRFPHLRAKWILWRLWFLEREMVKWLFLVISHFILYKANTNAFFFIIYFWNVVYLVLKSYKTNFLLITVFLFSTDVRNGHEKKKDLDTSVSGNSSANPTSVLKRKINTIEDDVQPSSAASGDVPST